MATVKELNEKFESLKESVENRPQVLAKVVTAGKKLRNFKGDPLDIREWLHDAQHSVRLQELDGRAAVDFLLSHLEGDAREEVRFSLDTSTCTEKDVYSTLKDAFAEHLSVSQLLDQFYSRKQGEREGLRDFIYSLMKILDRIVALDKTCVTDKDKTLRNTFIEKVRDKHLRKHLKGYVRTNEKYTFKDVRGEALLWAEEDHARPSPVTSHEIVTNGPTQGEQQSPVSNPQVSNSLHTQIADLLEVQRAQQQQIADLKKLVASKPKGKGDITCFYCKKNGHIKRDCYKFKADQQRGAGQRGDLSGGLGGGTSGIPQRGYQHMQPSSQGIYVPTSGFTSFLPSGGAHANLAAPADNQHGVGHAGISSNPFVQGN